MAPSSYQKRLKAENRQKIIRAIESKPTFKELSKATGLSDPVLSEYLKELQNDGTIRRQAQGKRLFYELTAEGLNAEQLRMKSVAQGTDLLRFLAKSPIWINGMNAMSKFAQGHPEQFEAYLDWYRDYIALMFSDEGLKWLNKFGTSSSSVMQNRLSKRMATFLKDRPKQKVPYSTEEMRTRFKCMLDAMREILSEENGRR